jgi:glycosyltransferase involved in cell wall biosynthesis
MPKKILFISKGEYTSSTRYRAMQFFPSFVAHDWQPTHSTISGGLIPIIKTLRHVIKADVVVLLRKTFPMPIFWALRKLSKRLIFDFDDAIFTNTDGSYSKTRMRRFIKTISKCDYIFAGNQYLADEAKKYNSNVSVIPTSVEVAKYDLPINRDSETFDLVWIGSKSTKKYITAIIPAIENAAKSIPNLRLKIIADFDLTSPILEIKNIAWTEAGEAVELSKCHVGLAPMINNNWTKGKCALKVLQYMATGLPVISSPSGVNAYVLENGVNGYLAHDSNEWSELIIQLAQEKNRLAQMGSFGKKRVNQEFSINVVFQKIISILQAESMR